MAHPRLPWAQQRAALLAVSRGSTNKQAGLVAGVSERSVNNLLGEHGRVLLRERKARPDALSSVEREEIFLAQTRGEPTASIARRLGRHRSTIWRELKANGGQENYRPFQAQNRADHAARRTRRRWFETRPEVWAQVRVLLGLRWSPQQIAAWLRAEYPNNPHWWVSHETIYQAIYIQTLPELRRELKACLRSGKIKRRPRSRLAQDRANPRIKDMAMISDRPHEIEDRAISGHWEGDLIIGRHSHSQIATLVERTTGFGMMIKLERRNAVYVAEQISRHMTSLPAQIRLSLTWDQGTEMADHKQFTVKSGIPVYFCDPRSPWQRGTNENWNGLVRQYLPKGTSLANHSQTELDNIAAEINDRPRARFGFKKPVDLFNQLVAPTS